MRSQLLILALVFTGTLCAQTSTPSGEVSQQQVNHPKSSDQHSKTDQEITIKSPVVVQLSPPTKTQKELDEETTERAERISNNNEVRLFTKWQRRVFQSMTPAAG
jgi:hypothetical protein